MGTGRHRLTREAPNPAVEQMGVAESRRRRLHLLDPSRGVTLRQREDGDREHQRLSARCSVVGLDLRLVGNVVGEAAERRNPEEGMREKAQQRQPEGITAGSPPLPARAQRPHSPPARRA